MSQEKSQEELEQHTLHGEEREIRRRKVRALLAGGLVLGVGAAVTLASWTSDDFASGIFTIGTPPSSSNVLEGSTDGSSYYTHGENSPAFVSFTESSQLPGESVYGSYWVRVAAGSTDDGFLTVASFVPAPLISPDPSDKLSWTIYDIGGDSCDGDTNFVGKPILAKSDGDFTGSFSNVSAINLNKGSSGQPGQPAQLCIVVTADGSATPGGQTSGAWGFQLAG